MHQNEERCKAEHTKIALQIPRPEWPFNFPSLAHASTVLGITRRYAAASLGVSHGDGIAAELETIALFVMVFRPSVNAGREWPWPADEVPLCLVNELLCSFRKSAF
jgi:hypothetical protein